MTLTELKKDIVEKEYIIGFNKVKKGIISDEFSKVYIASNCKEKEIIQNLCKLNNIKLEELNITNKELGIICKKTYSIGIIGFDKK
jgi:ribosomal protein L30E